MAGEVTLVVARAQNGVIGRSGTLPWHLPADLARFKALTMGKPMVMGRKTFESLPGRLPGRRHIVLTRDRSWSAAGAEVAGSPEAALRLAGGEDVSVIGGAEIIARFIHADLIDRAEVTVLWRDYDGDAVFDPDQADWIEESRDFHDAQGDLPAYTFFSMRRDLDSRSGRRASPSP